MESYNIGTNTVEYPEFTCWLACEKKHSSCINVIISAYSRHIFDFWSYAQHQDRKTTTYMGVFSSRARLK